MIRLIPSKTVLLSLIAALFLCSSSATASQRYDWTDTDKANFIAAHKGEKLHIDDRAQVVKNNLPSGKNNYIVVAGTDHVLTQAELALLLNDDELFKNSQERRNLAGRYVLVGAATTFTLHGVYCLVTTSYPTLLLIDIAGVMLFGDLLYKTGQSDAQNLYYIDLPQRQAQVLIDEYNRKMEDRP
jgi:hypothetical protein